MCDERSNQGEDFLHWETHCANTVTLFRLGENPLTYKCPKPPSQNSFFHTFLLPASILFVPVPPWFPCMCSNYILALLLGQAVQHTHTHQLGEGQIWRGASFITCPSMRGNPGTNRWEVWEKAMVTKSWPYEWSHPTSWPNLSWWEAARSTKTSIVRKVVNLIYDVKRSFGIKIWKSCMNVKECLYEDLERIQETVVYIPGNH